MIVSIVVPAYNEERLLRGSLGSIRAAMAAFDAAGWSSELIVCDNNSSDATARIAADAGARVVFERVNQIGRARNTGAAHARGNWLVFVDADSYPSVELFAAVVEQIRAGRCLAGGATVRTDSEHPMARAVTAIWNLTSRLAKWGAGSFIFCEADAFRQVGGFNQDLYAAEEIDLFRRLKRLAARTDRRIAILHRAPLLTSGRKIHLYNWRDALRFYSRLLFSGGRSLRSREGAFLWYDGKR